MGISPSELSDDQIRAVVERHDGNMTHAARELGCVRSTLARRAAQLGIRPIVAREPSRPHARLTRALVEQAMQPVNNCRVHKFADLLDDEERDVLDWMMSMAKEDLSAAQIRATLLALGRFSDSEVPGQDAINNHRAGRRPCYCKG